MSGKYNGIQAVITILNHLATYVPCAAHTLNLVGLHSIQRVTFFGIFQKKFNFLFKLNIEMGKADKKSKIVIERTKVNNVVSQKGGNLSTKKAM